MRHYPLFKDILYNKIGVGPTLRIWILQTNTIYCRHYIINIVSSLLNLCFRNQLVWWILSDPRYLPCACMWLLDYLMILIPCAVVIRSNLIGVTQDTLHQTNMVLISQHDVPMFEWIWPHHHQFPFCNMHIDKNPVRKKSKDF